MKKENRRRKIKKITKLLTLAFLLAGLFCMQGKKAEAKVKDGFVYTMDKEKILESFSKALFKKTITKKEIREIKKQFGKGKVCFILQYKGEKKNIRLPENIEGISDYVLCVSWLDGKKQNQVKNVTIPSTVKIRSILYDNPLKSYYYPYLNIHYKFHVEKGNRTVKSDKGMLYSRDGKILYAIPDSIRGKLVIPDGVEKILLPDRIYFTELRIGKDVKEISYMYGLCDSRMRKISVAKGNRHFTVKKNTLYSRDMETLYFSVPQETGCYVMPNTVRRIAGAFAFDRTKYSRIVLSDRLKHIPEYTFEGKDLKEIVLGKNTETVGDDFWGTKIKELEIPKSVKWIYGDAIGPRPDMKLIVYNKNLKMKMLDFDDSDYDYYGIPVYYTIDINSQKAKEILQRRNITLEIRE